MYPTPVWYRKFLTNWITATEHASHVTLSIIKLLSRIVKPSGKSKEMSISDHSYGITNDPLTHFAVAFCGLVHDADHPGKLIQWKYNETKRFIPPILKKKHLISVRLEYFSRSTKSAICERRSNPWIPFRRTERCGTKFVKTVLWFIKNG